jgi:hypothetical protein
MVVATLTTASRVIDAIDPPLATGITSISADLVIHVAIVVVTYVAKK